MKLVAEAGVGLVAAGVVKALADVVHIAGADGGTGASPLSSIKNAGAALGARPGRDAAGAGRRTGCAAACGCAPTAGIKTGRDVVVAALLGADEFSFGTALLLAEGCLMVRSCHLDTCPVGIATQRPELRAKFAATPEQVEAYLLFVAEDVRRWLASLGLRSLDEAVGRVDLPAPAARRATGARTRSTCRAAPGRAGDGRLRGRADAGRRRRRARASGWPTTRSPRSTAPRWSSRRTRSRPATARSARGSAALIGRRFGARPPPGRVRARFAGSAGQSFGAFLAAGVELELVGEANDYVGKGDGRRADRRSGRPTATRAIPCSPATPCSTARPAASSSAPAAPASGSRCATRARPRSSRASATTAAST